MGKLYKIFVPISIGASFGTGIIFLIQYKSMWLGIWILVTSISAFATYELRDKEVK